MEKQGDSRHNKPKWGGKKIANEKANGKKSRNDIDTNALQQIKASKQASKWITLNVWRYKILTKSFS